MGNDCGHYQERVGQIHEREINGPQPDYWNEKQRTLKSYYDIFITLQLNQKNIIKHPANKNEGYPNHACVQRKECDTPYLIPDESSHILNIRDIIITDFSCKNVVSCDNHVYSHVHNNQTHNVN